MDWLAVRSWIATELAVPLGEALTVGCAAVDEPAVAELAAGLADAVAVAEAVTSREPAAVVDEVGPNSVLLAGSSSRNEAKISSSSGSVHNTFAVSLGTTSPRG